MVTTLPAGDLPADVTGLVGRRAESAEVRRLLTASRLVTLTGVGGVGKTRLAVHVARAVQRAFPGGVRLVELAELADPALVPATLTHALGMLGSGGDVTTDLIEHLRPRHMLLVLDNCEHLVLECALLVGRLLPACPDLHVLATSREPLRVDGEHTYPVPTLSVPAKRSPAGADIARSDAVTLFADRAAAVSPGFTLTDDNRDAVAALCRRLDGLPLAIELAAVRMHAATPDELLTRLADPYRLLTTGNRAGAPRHRTLRAAIEWSHQRCSSDERTLWARLSVFAGGFAADAAEAVCAGDGLARDEVFDTLTGLVEKSVLVREEAGGRTRYRALRVIREFGRELLERRGEDARTRRRHHGYYLALAGRLERDWFGPGQETLFAGIRAEHGNLRVALESLLADPADRPRAQAMAAALWSHWVASGRQGEGRYWLDRALAGDTGRSPQRAAALWVNGYLALSQGDHAAGNRLARESQALAAGIGDLPNLAHATHVRGLLERNLGVGPAGTALLEEGVELEAGQREFNPYLVLARIELGWAYSLEGRTDQALALLADCRDTCARHGDRWLRSWALTFEGLARWLRGEFGECARTLRQAVQGQTALDDPLGLAVTTEVFAWAAMSEGDADRAARLLGASRAQWQPLGAYLGGFTLLDGSERCLRLARESLGDKAFHAAIEEGRKLTGAQTVALVLGDPAAGPPEPGPADPIPLTARESQVARLVAKGRTNKEIARELVVSLRTVDSHVQHILTKLGFNSRNQVVALFANADAPGR